MFDVNRLLRDYVDRLGAHVSLSWRVANQTKPQTKHKQRHKMAYMHRSSDTGDLSLGPTDVGVDVGGVGGGGRASVGAGSDVDIDAVLPHRRGNVHAASHLQCVQNS